MEYKLCHWESEEFRNESIATHVLSKYVHNPTSSELWVDCCRQLRSMRGALQESENAAPQKPHMLSLSVKMLQVVQPRPTSCRGYVDSGLSCVVAWRIEFDATGCAACSNNAHSNRRIHSLKNPKSVQSSATGLRRLLTNNWLCKTVPQQGCITFRCHESSHILTSLSLRGRKVIYNTQDFSEASLSLIVTS
jgi:hypothetical protein